MALHKFSITASGVAVEGGANGFFTIHLDQPAPAGGLPVYFNTTASTALLNTDYTFKAGAHLQQLNDHAFTIEAGATSARLAVVALTDKANDSHERVSLTVRLSDTASSVVNFAGQQSYEVGDWPVAIRSGDFNQDGNADLVVANRDSDNLSLLLGNGRGGFAEQKTLAVGNYPSALYVADMNRDGFLDIVTNAGIRKDELLLLRGDGEGHFKKQAISMDTGTTSLLGGDFNQDGRPDLITVNSGNGRFSLLLATETGDFVSKPIISVKGHIPFDAVAVADFNGDGYSDVAAIVVQFGGDLPPVGIGRLILLMGQGDGELVRQNKIPLESAAYSITVGDFNDDGQVDLLIPDWNLLFVHHGQNGFTQSTLAENINFGVEIIDDFNNDGYRDLAGIKYDAVTIALGNGQNGYSTDNSPFAVNGYKAMTHADFNNDGLLDVATVNEFFHNISVLLNSTTTQTSTLRIISDTPLILSGTAQADTLHGEAGNDKLQGFNGNDHLFGGAGNDTLQGGKGNDLLYGGAGNDVLMGGLGNDVLMVGLGHDILTGGEGRDIFKCAWQLSASYHTRISDFTANTDTIQLNQRAFDNLPIGVLTAEAFVIAPAAVDESDRLIYDDKTGILSYDTDGVGGHEAVQIAVLGKALTLSAADFLVI